MTPNWIIEKLDEHGIHYEHLHRPEGFTPEALATNEHGCRQSAAEVAVAVADGKFLELVMPADSWADLEKVREITGCEQVRFATEVELFENYADCEPGTIPALRRVPGSDVLMDSWVDINGNIVFLAGTFCDALRMPIQDWMELVNPRIASFGRPVDKVVEANF